MDSIGNNSYLLVLDGNLMSATVTASVDFFAVAPSIVIKYLERCSERICGVHPTPDKSLLPGLEVARCTVHISVAKEKVEITINDWRTRELLFAYEGDA